MVEVRDTKRKWDMFITFILTCLFLGVSFILSGYKSKKWKKVSVPCRKFGMYRKLWSSRMKVHPTTKGERIFSLIFFILVLRQSHSVTGICFWFSVYPRIASCSPFTCLSFPSTEILGITDVCHRNWLPPPPNCFKNPIKAGEMTQFMKQTWEPGSEFLGPV